MSEQLGRPRGLLVASIEPDSPAENGGILVGDVLLALDGEPLLHLEDLLAALTGDRLGRPVALDVLRGGAATTLQVQLAERTVAEGEA
jgi:S1-C subfamily serine protease